MKYKVVKPFTDKYTGEKHQVNDILEVSKERAEEILMVDKLIEKVKENKKNNRVVE